MKEERFIKRALDSGKEWTPALVRAEYYEMLERAQAHGTPVFHAYCPAITTFVEHENWERKFGRPMREWGEQTSSRYPNFVYWAPERLKYTRTEFANTVNHVNEKTSKDVTARLLPHLRAALGQTE